MLIRGQGWPSGMVSGNGGLSTVHGQPVRPGMGVTVRATGSTVPPTAPRTLLNVQERSVGEEKPMGPLVELTKRSHPFLKHLISPREIKSPVDMHRHVPKSG